MRLYSTQYYGLFLCVCLSTFSLARFTFCLYAFYQFIEGSPVRFLFCFFVFSPSLPSFFFVCVSSRLYAQHVFYLRHTIRYFCLLSRLFRPTFLLCYALHFVSELKLSFVSLPFDLQLFFSSFRFCSLSVCLLDYAQYSFCFVFCF